MREESSSETGGENVPPPVTPGVQPGSGPSPSLHDPGALDSIPWRDRISTQLLGVAAALVLATVVTFAVVEMTIARQRLSGVTSSTGLLSETISASLRNAMMADQRAEAYAIIDNHGRQPGIDHVRLFN